MNYRQIYDNLMAKAKLRGLDKAVLDGYYEMHHVLPRCLDGGDEDSNLVLLTGREHYVAHLLLSKAYPDVLDLTRAVIIFLKDKGGRKLTSRQIQGLRLKQSAMLKELAAKGDHPWQTEEYKAANSKRMAEYQNDKVAKGEHQWQTAEHAESRRQAITAYNLSDANPSRKPENRLASSLRLKAKHTCSFCKYTGKGHANMKRYHFANCKSLTSHVVATNLATGAVHKFLTVNCASDFTKATKVHECIAGRRQSSNGWSFKLVDVSLLVP